MSALLFLFRLNSIGGLRRLWRASKTIEGAIKSLFALGFVLLLSAPLIMAALQQGADPPPAEIIVATRYVAHNVFPILLTGLFFAFLISPRTDHCLDFRPAEIEFLFPAPFSRRQLIIYKLLGVVTSTLAVSLGISVFLGGSFFLFDQPFWITFLRGFSTLFLSFLLFRLTFILSGLIRKSIVVRLVSPIQKGLAALLVFAFFVGMYSIRDQFHFDLVKDFDPVKLLPVLKAFVATQWCQIAITPARIFSNILLSTSIGGTLLWGSASLAVNASVIYLILKTNDDFIETEISVSQQKAQMAKRQSNAATAFIVGDALGTIPMLPFMSGIGPIAWRQLQTFYRTRQFIIGGLIFYFLMVTFLVWTSQKPDSSNNQFAMVLTMVVSISLIGPTIIPMGFQYDINKMDILKSLPFSRWQIAAGQMLGPAIGLVSIQMATIFVFMFTALEYLGYFFVLAIFAPLATTIMLCIVNSLSLLYPTRKEQGVVNQFENIGHILVFVFLIGVVGTIILGLLGSVGGAAYFLTRSLVVTLFASWVVMLMAATTGVWLTGWAFERFDVSKQKA